MKNIFYHILSIAVVLSSLVACTIVEPIEPRSEEVTPEGKVSIYFGVNMAENGATQTKSMERADTPKIERMYVAVFGGSHFLKEYVQAYPVKKNSSDEWVLGDWASTNGNSTTYYFRADLTPSNSSGMHLHFIANGPTYLDFDYENTVISNALTEAGADVGAYWQMMTVNGIKAAAHDNPDTGMTEYERQNVPVSASNTIETYVWSDATASQFATPVVLVRNFAKIKVVDDAPDFTLKAYALVNTPAQGAVAPYNSNTDSFMSDYYTFHYSGLRDVYPGRLPAGVAINGINTLTESHFSDNSIYPEVVKPGKSGETKDGLYVYERPAVNISQGNPTYIVLYGEYNGQNYFYRVDLSDDTNSNIIFRNFQYIITISGISRPGSTHLSDDMTSAGDISSTTPSTLSEVSNGESKLWVQTTERLLINHPYDTVRVKIKYYPDGSTINNSLLTFDYTPQRDEYAVIKEDASVDKQYIRLEGTNTTDDCYLVFTRTAASAIKQRQSVTIYGNKDVGGTLTPTLFRTIDFIQWQQQTFVVTCTPEVLREKNKPVAVNIYLPLGLERSMFPLNINIMADKFSLSPASGESLPVQVGNIATGNTVRGFYYVKTIDTYEDYLALTEESVMVNGVSAQRKKIVCNFVTNKEKSASGIYVTAKNFIDNNAASFVDYKMHEFTNTLFSSKETTINRPVVLYFTMDNDADPEEVPHSGKVTVDLAGLRLDPSHSTENQVHFASLQPDDAGYYYYDPADNPSGVIYLLTGETATSTSFDGTYGATLSAYHYVTAELDQDDIHLATFSNLGFYSRNNNGTYSSMTSLELGMNKTVYFRFDYENGYTGSSYPVTFTLNGLTTDDSRLVDNGNGTFTFTPTDNNQSQYVQLKSTTRFSAVSVQISNNRYNPVDARTLNRETSFIIPANTIYIRNANTGNPTGFTTGNSGTYVNLNNSNATGYIARSRYSNSYLNNSAMTVALNNFSIVNDDAVVYFNYTANNTTYYATSTLSELLEATTSNRVTLHFRGRIQNTYTVTLSYANYTQASFSNDYVQLTFTNTEYGTNGNNYYKIMGSGQTNGSMTVSQVGSHDEFSITQISLTYRGNNYRNGAVTPTSGSYARNTNTGTWTGGAESVTLTMGKDGNNFNWVRVVTITYSYLE